MITPPLTAPKPTTAPAVPPPNIHPMSPEARVLTKFKPDLIKLGATDVRSVESGKLHIDVDHSSRAHRLRNIVSPAIDGVELVFVAKMNARCIPEPVDPVKAAKLIATAGIEGVVGADVRSTAYGSPTMHIQAAPGLAQRVDQLFQDKIGGAPVVIDAPTAS